MKQYVSAISLRRLPILVLAFVIGIVTLVFSTLPGFDFWNSPQAEQTLEQELRRSEQLDDAIEIVRCRNDIRCEVLEDLAAGRISFAYAVQRNKELNEQAPEITSVLRNMYPTLSDEESIAIQVLEIMKFRNWENAGVGVALMQRLENEFNAMKSSIAPEVR
jgi:hypothetical protein